MIEEYKLTLCTMNESVETFRESKVITDSIVITLDFLSSVDT